MLASQRFNWWLLVISVLLATGGRLGDLYGRKRVFLLGVCGFTLCSALCSFAPNTSLLIVFRLAQGATAALMAPQVISLIQVSFAPKERPIAVSAYATTLGLASLLGQIMGGALLAANLLNMGWRSIFLVNIPLGLAVLIAAGVMVRESSKPGVHTLDYGGVALLTLALALFIFPLVLGSSAGWPLWTKVSLPLSAPFFLAFLAYERRTTKQEKLPLVTLAFFRLRPFAAGMLTNLLSQLLFSGLLFLFSIYLQTLLRLSPLQSGLAVSVGSIRLHHRL